jgi:hypothetical protein
LVDQRHELGHALVARLYGVDVEELVATPEGRAISVTIGGLPMRIGLGLKRELRSKEMAGWVKLREAGLSARKERHILWAGPIAHGGFSAMLLAIGGLAHLPAPVPLPLVVSDETDRATADSYDAFVDCPCRSRIRNRATRPRSHRRARKHRAKRRCSLARSQSPSDRRLRDTLQAQIALSRGAF